MFEVCQDKLMWVQRCKRGRGGGRSQAWSRSNPIGGGWLKMVWSHAQILTFLSFSLCFWTSKCKRVKIAVNLEVLWFVALSHISNQICPSSNFQPSLSVCVPVWLIGATKTQPIFRFQVLIANFSGCKPNQRLSVRIKMSEICAMNYSSKVNCLSATDGFGIEGERVSDQYSAICRPCPTLNMPASP